MEGSIFINHRNFRRRICLFYIVLGCIFSPALSCVLCNRAFSAVKCLLNVFFHRIASFRCFYDIQYCLCAADYSPFTAYFLRILWNCGFTVISVTTSPSLCASANAAASATSSGSRYDASSSPSQKSALRYKSVFAISGCIVITRTPYLRTSSNRLFAKPDSPAFVAPYAQPCGLDCAAVTEDIFKTVPLFFLMFAKLLCQNHRCFQIRAHHFLNLFRI